MWVEKAIQQEKYGDTPSFCVESIAMRRIVPNSFQNVRDVASKEIGIGIPISSFRTLTEHLEQSLDQTQAQRRHKWPRTEFVIKLRTRTCLLHFCSSVQMRQAGFQ